MTKVTKSLAQTQEAVNRERAAALRFIDEFEVGSLPGHRSETGESAGAQRVGHSSNPTSPARQGTDTGDLPRKHRDTLSYDSMGGLSNFEEYLLDNNQQYLPLVSADAPPPDFETMDRRARMNHCLSFLTEGQRRDIERKHLEQMTLQQIADEDKCSRQAVHKRLKRAEVAFQASYAEHWADINTVEDW